MTDMLRSVAAPPTRRSVANAALGAGAIAAILASTTSDSDEGLVLCPFRRCTGGYCPGCGGTRAAGRLFRGDVVGAWHRHPFVVLLAVQLLVLGALASSERGRERITSVRLPIVVANTALLVGLWIVRLGLGDIPGVF